MITAIEGLDHALVGVQDLEAARRNWTRLGFHACPRGRHIGWGTANYCLMFAQNYIELLGIVDPTKFTNNLDHFLAQREGFLGLAFRSGDAEVTADFLRRQGGEVVGPTELKRVIELPAGDALPAFRLVHPERRQVPGLSAFFCQHLSADLVWQAAFLTHPNGALGIKGVVTVVAEPGALAQDYGALFGAEAVAVSDGLVAVRAGNCGLTFATAQALAEVIYPALPAPPDLSEPYTLALQIAVADLQATEAFFTAAAVPFLGLGDRLLLSPAQANGVLLEFLPAVPEGGDPDAAPGPSV
jgi:catechol 2,3-dioxygenase-like lactoylglutathione lyase family enzyme